VKTVSKNNVVKRIENLQVDSFLSRGYILCPKSLWKEKVRNPKAAATEAREATKNKKKSKKS